MADYKIVCTDQEPVTEPTDHAHIVSVGIDTDNDGYANERQSKGTVIENIERGLHRYYTVGPYTNQAAFVQVALCGYCNGKIIRSTPDATTDNNLDSLRRCDWNS